MDEAGPMEFGQLPGQLQCKSDAGFLVEWPPFQPLAETLARGKRGSVPGPPVSRGAAVAGSHDARLQKLARAAQLLTPPRHLASAELVIQVHDAQQHGCLAMLVDRLEGHLPALATELPLYPVVLQQRPGSYRRDGHEIRLQHLATIVREGRPRRLPQSAGPRQQGTQSEAGLRSPPGALELAPDDCALAKQSCPTLRGQDCP